MNAFCIAAKSKFPRLAPLAPGLNVGLGAFAGLGLNVGTVNPFFCRQLFCVGVKFVKAPPNPRRVPPSPFASPPAPKPAPGLFIEFGIAALAPVVAFAVGLAAVVAFAVGLAPAASALLVPKKINDVDKVKKASSGI